MSTTNRVTCVCAPAEHSILDMYNCTGSGHKFLGELYCWRHLFNKIAGMRKCGHPSCVHTNHFHAEGRSDAQGQWFCAQHANTQFSRYSCDAFIIWALKQQSYPPDLVRHIYLLVVRGLKAAQLEAAAKALHRRQQRQHGRMTSVL